MKLAIVWAFVFLFFGAWFGFAYYGSRQGWSRTIRFGGGFLAATIGFSIVGTLVMNIAETSTRISASSISNTDEAKKFLIGTWTYTQPIDQSSRNASYIWNWEKWVVKDDGTVDVYTALPTADNWGQPKNQPYEIYTSKYSDTGKRYYAIRLNGTMVHANIVEDDVIGLAVGQSEPVPMMRGDKNPFSK